ncbi:MAG: hypothetical protein M0001_05165 [Treponema sp.]|nr:hypothetical protein [Treponema sp.]
MLKPESNRAELRRWLESWGLFRMVTKETQQVATADYSGRIIPLSLDQFDKRIAADDPRRDPWTESLGTWFAASIDGKVREVWYIHEGILPKLAPRTFSAGLEARGVIDVATLGNGGAAHGGAAPHPALWLKILLGIVGCLPFFGIARKKRIVALGLGLPWLAYLVVVPDSFGALAVAAMALVPFSTEILVKNAGRDFPGSRFPSLSSLGAPLLPLILPWYGAMLFQAPCLPSFALLALSSFFSGKITFLLRPSFHSMRFVPIPILNASSSILRMVSFPKLAMTFGLAMAAIVPLSVSAAMEQGSPPISAGGLLVPLPNTADTMPKGPPIQSLPGLEEWRFHLGNEAAFFTRSLRLSESRRGLERISPTPRQESANNAIELHPSGGIERVLAAQGAAGAYSVRSPSGGSGEPLALWRPILYILSLLLAFAAIGARLIIYRKGPGYHP